MSYKWNHTVYVTFWDWLLFSLSITSLRSIQVAAPINSSFFFIDKEHYCIVWCTRVCWNIYPLKDIWIVFSILSLWKKVAMNISGTSFCVNITSHVSKLNFQECNYWIIWLIDVGGKAAQKFYRVVIPFSTV